MLESSNILLRAVEPDDLDFLYRCENDTSVWRYGNTTAPYSKFALKQYIEDAQSDIYTAKQLRLIICRKDANNEPVGAIDLFDFDPYHLRTSVGIVVVGDENRGHGYASESLQLIIGYAFDFLHLHQLYCSVAADNTASLHIFDKAGFRRCGLRAEWLHAADGYIDEIEMQLINS